jgi:WD40 repeat protein
MQARITLGSVLFLLIATLHASAQDHSKPLKVLEWRSEIIRSLAFTSDGKQLVVSPKDRECWVFDAETGVKSDQDLKGRGPTNLLLTGPRPGTIYCFEDLVSRLVDLKTGKDITNNGTLVQLAASGQLSLKRDWLLMAAASGGVQMITSDMKRSEGSFEPADPPPSNPKDWACCAAAYSPDGKFVAGARPTGRLTLWTAEGPKQTGAQGISAHTGKIDALWFTTSELISLGLDGKVKRWNPADGHELAVFSFGAQLDRGWLLAEGQIAAIVRKPVAGELEFFRIPTKAGDELKLLATIPIVTLFDGFPTVNREFTIPQIALSPNGQRLALCGQSGSVGLTITQTGIYDVSGFMPKLMVNAGTASASDNDPRVTGTASKPPLTKTTPAPKPEREFREWSTADGQFKVEAQFLGKTGDTIRLKRKDNGKVIAVPLEKFSEADQAYVRSLR